MKRYSIPTILFVFLSSAVIVACHKERVRFLGSAINGYSTAANNIYLDFTPVSGTDQVFYFFNSSPTPLVATALIAR